MLVTKKPATKKAKKKVQKKTHIALVLDKSGSMMSCWESAISGFNAQMDVIEANASKGGETTLTVVTFNGIVDILQKAVPANRIEKLTKESYVPNGSTAMRDGVWDAIAELEKLDDGGKQTAFLVVTISDGMENASKRTSSEKLAEKIQQLELTGRWTFGYVGANQDLSVIQESLNINADCTLSYTTSTTGYYNMSNALSAATTNYFNGRGNDVTYTAAYFSKPTPIQKSE